MEQILGSALLRLNRMDSYEGYLDYMRSEWYSRVSDMILALEDDKAWKDLRLPSRLKLELKSELLGLQAGKSSKKPDNQASKAPSVNDSQETPLKFVPLFKVERWTKCYSSADDCFFFYNNESQVTQWEVPTGNIEIEDDISAATSPATSFLSDMPNHDDSVSNFCDLFVAQSTYTDTSSSETFKGSREMIENESLTANLTTPEPENVRIVSLNSTFVLDSNAVLVTAYAVPDGVAVGVADSTDFDDRNTSMQTILTASPDVHRIHVDGGPDLLMAQRLVDMGFTFEDACAALKRTDNNLSTAASILLQSRRPSLPRNAMIAPPPKIKPNKISKSIKSRLGFGASLPPPSAPPSYL